MVHKNYSSQERKFKEVNEGQKNWMTYQIVNRKIEQKINRLNNFFVGMIQWRSKSEFK